MTGCINENKQAICIFSFSNPSLRVQGEELRGEKMTQKNCKFPASQDGDHIPSCSKQHKLGNVLKMMLTLESALIILRHFPGRYFAKLSHLNSSPVETGLRGLVDLTDL